MIATIVKVAWRELWLGRRRLWLPGLALVIAAASLFLLRGLQLQIESKIQQEARGQLGADLKIEAFREIPPGVLQQVRDILPKDIVEAREIELNTMLVLKARGENRFVRLSAVEKNFPLYGNYSFDPPEFSFDRLQERQSSTPSIVLPSDLAQLLNLKLGDQVNLGEQTFAVAALVKKATGGLSGFLSFAPSVWISQKDLAATKLLDRPGRIGYETSFKIIDNSNLSQLAPQIREILGDPSYRVVVAQEGDRGFQRVFGQVKLFAQLITLAALVLSGFAIFGTFQNWLFDRRYLLALMRSLGATNRQVKIFLYSALGMFSFVSISLGSFVGWFLFRLSIPLLVAKLGLDVSVDLPWHHFALSAGLGVLIPLLFGSYAFSDAAGFQPLILLRSQIFTQTWSRMKVIYLGVVVILLCGMSLLLVGDLKKGLWLSLGIMAAGLIGLGVSDLLLRGIQSLANLKAPLVVRYPMRSLFRERSLSLLGASIFFLLSVILSLMLTLEGSLRKEFSVEQDVERSSLFVFDVGGDEKVAIDASFSQLQDVKTLWAPSIRLRWRGINGQEPDYRDPDEARFTSEMFVTEVEPDDHRDRLVSGRLWTSRYSGQGNPEISLTREFARRYSIDLGDELNLELYGVPFSARVTSFRVVRWTDFQPGFRMALQAGFFDPSLLNYVGAVESKTATGRMAARKVLAQKFPGISAVDVAQVKADLVRVMGDISWALKAILALLVLLGVTMVAVLTQEKISLRWKDFATLRCLGARVRTLRLFLVVEFVLLTFVPAMVGVGLGIVANQLLLIHFFNIDATGGELAASLLPLLILGLVLLVTWLSSIRLRDLRPRMVFQDA